MAKPRHKVAKIEHEIAEVLRRRGKPAVRQLVVEYDVTGLSRDELALVGARHG